MSQSFAITGRHVSRITLAIAVALAGASAAAQSVHEAPSAARSTGRIAPQAEPGQPRHVSGVVVGPDDAPIGGASLYATTSISCRRVRDEEGLPFTMAWVRHHDRYDTDPVAGTKPSQQVSADACCDSHEHA